MSAMRQHAGMTGHNVFSDLPNRSTSIGGNMYPSLAGGFKHYTMTTTNSRDEVTGTEPVTSAHSLIPLESGNYVRLTTQHYPKTNESMGSIHLYVPAASHRKKDGQESVSLEHTPVIPHDDWPKDGLDLMKYFALKGSNNVMLLDEMSHDDIHEHLSKLAQVPSMGYHISRHPSDWAQDRFTPMDAEARNEFRRRVPLSAIASNFGRLDPYKERIESGKLKLQRPLEEYLHVKGPEDSQLSEVPSHLFHPQDESLIHFK